MMTQWVNTITGEWLERSALASLRVQARRAYEANTHIFEDEVDALAAFGVVPARQFERETVQLTATAA
jgi:hypothetical protein